VCQLERSLFSVLQLNCCSVRQGDCVLSLFLFAVFIDGIKSSNVGCSISTACRCIFLYADDILLIAPFVSGLQILLNACEEDCQPLIPLLPACRHRHNHVIIQWLTKKVIAGSGAMRVTCNSAPGIEERSIVSSMSVCIHLCVFVITRPIFLVLLWQRCDRLCSSCFVDDVILVHNGP